MGIADKMRAAARIFDHHGPRQLDDLLDLVGKLGPGDVLVLKTTRQLRGVELENLDACLQRAPIDRSKVLIIDAAMEVEIWPAEPKHLIQPSDPAETKVDRR